MNVNENIVLFAFRKRHQAFFKQVLSKCKNKNISIVTSRESFLISLKSFRYVKKAKLQEACDFAVEAFYARLNIQVPRVILQIYFQLLAKIYFLRYFTALDQEYTKILIWNGGKYRERIAIEVAKIKGIKVYFFENALLPNTIVFDEKGINYNNSVPREKFFYQNYTSTIVLPTKLIPRKGKNKNTHIGRKGMLPEKYIFVPFQVDYDTQIISQSFWIKNMRMLFDTIENISSQYAYHFVLKEHPSTSLRYPDLHKRISKIPTMSFQNTMNTQELIEGALAVVTINSTVGVESLLLHKKVIVLGNAFYAIEDISYQVRNEYELLQTINEIETLKLDNHLVDNFLRYLYGEYLLQKNDKIYETICQKLFQNKGRI